jgi:hypothetical protein
MLPNALLERPTDCIAISPSGELLDVFVRCAKCFEMNFTVSLFDERDDEVSQVQRTRVSTTVIRECTTCHLLSKKVVHL